MKQFRHLEKINKELEKENDKLKSQNSKFNAATVRLMKENESFRAESGRVDLILQQRDGLYVAKETLKKENERLKRAVNLKNIIIENSLRSIELLKSQIEGKS